MRWPKLRLWWWLLGSLVFAVGLVATPRLYTQVRYGPQLQVVAEAPAAPVALIFGAGVRRNGSPTPVLYDRIATGVELYHAGKVQKLLFTGDGTTNIETRVMQNMALELGVHEADIWLDAEGLRTYDSCARAHDVFGITEALLVTQQFHLPRALFLCEAVGVQVVGVIADRRQYSRSALVITHIREALATVNAWWDVFTIPGASFP